MSHPNPITASLPRLVGVAIVTLSTICSAFAGRAVPEVIALSEAVKAQPTGEALAKEQDNFRSLFSDGEFDSALESAKQVVALTSEVWGTQSEQLGQALTNLAIAQTEVSNFVAAQQNFEAAIRVHELADRSLVSPSLINPLRGLASTRVALSDFEEAIPLYERAIHVSHVTAGPSNLNQVEDMDALSRAHFFIGEAKEANTIQEKMYRLQQRNFSTNSDGYLTALDRRARWFTEIGDFTQATYTLRRLERVIAQTYGRDDIRLIQPLIRLSFVTSKQDTSSAGLTPEIASKEARRAVNRAVRIARVHEQTDPSLLARTLASRGDFLLTTNAVRTAANSYRESFETIQAHEQIADLADELYAKPKIVAREPIRPVYHTAAGNLPTGSYPNQGFVEVAFDTNSVGRPIRVRITDSNPAGLMDSAVMRGVRRFVYRPQYVNGKPVVAQGLTFRHDFRYDDRRLTQSEKAYIERAEAARAKQRPAAAEPTEEQPEA